MPRKKDSPLTEPTLTQNPPWLALDPTSGHVAPPTKTKRDRLPFLVIQWMDFEKLAWRLAGRGAHVEQAWHYGTSGQSQYGIDLLVRLADGKYEVWQTKRYRKISAADVRIAAQIFMRHKWSEKASRFVLAVACDTSSKRVVEALEEFRSQLTAKNIKFETLV